MKRQKIWAENAPVETEEEKVEEEVLHEEDWGISVVDVSCNLYVYVYL